MTLWLTIVAAGLLTFLIRLSFIALLGRLTMPEWFHRALRFVPAAVLSAIIVPELVIRNAVLDVSPFNARLLAGVVAGAVAWRTRNVLLTIVAGMLALLVLQAVLPGGG